MKKNTYLAIIIVCVILLFFLFSKKKKTLLFGDFDSFESGDIDEYDIVKQADEFQVFNPVPAIANNPSQEDLDCQESGFVEFTFNNPTANPITINLLNTESYYNAIAQASFVFSNSVQNLGYDVIDFVIANNLFVSLNNTAGNIIIYSAVDFSILATVSLPLMFVDNTASLTLYENKVYVNGFNLLALPNSRVAVIDIDPNSGTYLTRIANVALSITTNKPTAYYSNRIIYSGGNAGNSYIETVNINTYATFAVLLTPPVNIGIIYPKLKYSQLLPANTLYMVCPTQARIYYFNVVTTLMSFDAIPSIPYTGILGSTPSCVLNNKLYFPMTTTDVAVVDITINSYLSAISTVATQAEATLSNGLNTVYAITSGNVYAIDVNTDTVIATIPVTVNSTSSTINFPYLYLPDSTTGLVEVIDVDEASATYNTVVNSYTTSSPSFGEFSLVGNINGTNTVATIAPNSIVTSYNPPSALQPTEDFLKNAQLLNGYAVNNGLICGILYRSLTRVQMNNIFSINTNDVTGNFDIYNLRPASYVTITQFQNQVFMNNFFKKIIITNSISIDHVINAGESVYVKISISKAVVLSDALQTGKVKASENDGKIEDPWLTVEEIEEHDWEAIIIECPEK